SFRLQIAVIRIWKSHDDMKMFGVGQIIQKSNNSDNMPPPAKSFKANQSISAHAFKQRSNQAANGKSTCYFVMFRTAQLKQLVAGIHGKKQRHQNNFRKQNNIGIAAWP